MTPLLSARLVGTSGIGTAAAASNAAILGPAEEASFDHPAVSRRLAKMTGLERPVSPAASDRTDVAKVQPTVNGLSCPAMVRKRCSSEPQSCFAVVTSAL